MMAEDEKDELEAGAVDVEDDDDEDDEDEPPRVVLARVGELASWLSPQLARNHRDRPAWFILEMDEDFVGVLERLPESPLPPRVAEQILAGVRAFAEERSDLLQQWLGPTDSIVFGFHTSATYEEVQKAFEDDGFLVVGRVREGRVIAIEEVPSS